MRILIHSNAPWVPTGYGIQARQLGNLLRSMGDHEVIFSAFSGLGGSEIVWDGFRVLPSGQMQFGIDTLVRNAQTNQVDLIITLMDFYKLWPIAQELRQFDVLAWLPVDCTPLSVADELTLRESYARPVAMSRFGAEQLDKAGFEADFARHTISDIFQRYTEPERASLRDELGFTGKFVIGINAANNDTIRKAFPEQFEAFRRLLDTVPHAHLLVHSVARRPGGVDLAQLADDLKIPQNAISFPDAYLLDTGTLDTADMTEWYNLLDVLSLTSYAEGFGIPLIEAQACGVPVVTSSWSAMVEHSGPGSAVVSGTAFWNHVHRAWWYRPDVDSIHARYQEMYTDLASPEWREDIQDRLVNFTSKWRESCASAEWEQILGRYK